MRRIAPLGLRSRLIAAFLLVAAISAVTTAALTYQQARNAILKQTQDTAISTLRDQVEQQEIRLPLDQPELQRVVIELGRRANRTRGSSSASTAACASPPTPTHRPPA